MSATTLLQRDTISGGRLPVRGRAGRPAVRRSARRVFSVSYVRKGSFGYRSRGRVVRAGGRLDPGRSSRRRIHVHARPLRAATSACRSSSRRTLVDALGCRHAFWRAGGVPPLPELMVLGELAQAAAEGRSDVGLDEVGAAAGRRASSTSSSGRAPTRPSAARARSAPCGRSGAVDRRNARTSRSTSRARRAEAGLSPFHFLRLFTQFSASRRTSISCARACAARRGCWPRTTRSITDIAFDVGFGDLSNFVRTLPSRRRRVAAAIPPAARGRSQDFPRSAGAALP